MLRCLNFRTIISRPDIPLRGISWLVHEFRITDMGRWRWKRVVTDEAWSAIVKRAADCDLASRRDAMFAIHAILNGRAQKLLTEMPSLVQWLNESSSESAYAGSSLINDIYNESKDLASTLGNAVDLAQLSRGFGDASTSEWYGWGCLFDRLTLVLSAERREQLAQLLKAGDLVKRAESAKPDELADLAKMAMATSNLDGKLPHDAATARSV